jgi:hypothetical protein
MYLYSDARSSQTLKSLENSIRKLTVLFQGKNAFNFSHEIELTAFLMVLTREGEAIDSTSEPNPIYLTRMEWPCLRGRSIDLVIWKPGVETMARSKWGTQRGRLAKAVELLAAVQVKRGGGNVTTWSATKKDLDDLETISNAESLSKPMLYFLEWADESLTEVKGDKGTYDRVRANLADWCGKAPEQRRALVVSRDNVGFAYPSGGWMVDPLPPGARETI